MIKTYSSNAADCKVLALHGGLDNLCIGWYSKPPNIVQTGIFGPVLAIKQHNLTLHVLGGLFDDGKQLAVCGGGGADNEYDRRTVDCKLVYGPYIRLTVCDLTEHSFACVEIDKGETKCW